MPFVASAQTTVTSAQQYYGLGSLKCAAYSPDGNYILTGGSAGAFLWDAATGQVLRVFQGHLDVVDAVAFSPDGAKVLTGSYDSTAKMWNASDGTLLRTFSGHTYSVYSVAFSPDGSKVLTGGQDQTAKLWNATDGALLRTFSGAAGIWSVAFSPDGTKVLTGAGWGDNTASLWNTSDGALIRTFSGHAEDVLSAAFSPDGAMIVTGSADNTAKLWNTSDGALLHTFPADRYRVTSVAFSPNGTEIATGGWDPYARLWNATDGTLLHTFSGHTNAVHSVAFSPDGTKVLTASDDMMAKLWSASDGTVLRTFSGHTDWINDAALSPDGTKVLTGGWDSTAKLWNVADGTLLRTIPSQAGGRVNAVAFSPDGTKALTGSADRRARLWNVSDAALLRTFSGHTDSIYSVAFSPDGAKVLTGAGLGDNTAKLWNASDGMLLRTFSGNMDRVYSVAFSADGKMVLTGSSNGNAILWDASDGTALRTFFNAGGLRSTALSLDGTMVLTAGGGREVRLWNASDGTLLRTIYGPLGAARSAAFSPDGTMVLTGHNNSDAKLWNASDGTLLRNFSGHIYTIDSVAFSPGGTGVLTGSIDGTARLWEIWRPKAVIVAGGEDYSGNPIAEQTEQLGAYCYKICRRRGYAADEIQYLSAFGPQDADGDGNDDVDAYATPDAIRDAILNFTTDTARLFIYMVDHGYRVGDAMYFQMNPTQALAASALDAWLDERQASTMLPPLHATLIVDTCYSGNFVTACAPPPGKRRITITSTTSDTVAVFLPPPSLTSFSYQFLGALYMGYKVQQAFASARQFFQSVSVAGQSPWIDSDGDGVYTPGVDDSATGPAADEFFGTSWAYAAGGGWEPPAFADETPTQSPPLGTTVTIWVEMLWNQFPEKVWATILPPAAEPLAGEALTDLPRVELAREGATQRWSAQFGGLDTVGDYVVAHVAQFEGARITQPVYSILSVGAPANPPPLKSIIVSGDDGSSAISSQTIMLANLAYRVSRHRGYEVEDIRYLSAFGNQDADGDLLNDIYASATVANLTDALGVWAASDCEQLLVYLVGPGRLDGDDGAFRLNATEALTTHTFDARLDTLQNGNVKDVIVVADFPYAADFLRECLPPSGRSRVLIAGTDSANAVFLQPPQVTSFSFNFLSAAHMGHDLFKSFESTRQFFDAATNFGQTPWLDDNGDGIHYKDGSYARTLHWGFPWAFAGPEGSELPFIIEAGAQRVDVAGYDVTLWAHLMEGPVPRRVIATIIPPTVAYTPGRTIADFPQIELAREGQTWRWSGIAGGFGRPGIYMILCQAVYEDNRLSVPVLTRLSVGTSSRNWHLY